MVLTALVVDGLHVPGSQSTSSESASSRVQQPQQLLGHPDPAERFYRKDVEKMLDAIMGPSKQVDAGIRYSKNVEWFKEVPRMQFLRR